MYVLSLFLILFLSISCGPGASLRLEKLGLNETGKTSVIIIGAHVTEEFKQEAQALDIAVEGGHILRLTGDADDLNALSIPTSQKSLKVISDIPIEVETNKFGELSSFGLYQAKKDFGLFEFLKKYPQADGRGVTVGIVDDGISPHQSGLMVTSTGERKLLKKGSQSSFMSFPLSSGNNEFTAIVKEGPAFSKDLDLNLDGSTNSWNATVSSDAKKICLDLNVDNAFSSEECKGAFSTSGEYFRLPKNKALVIMAEVDLEKKILKLLQPEKDDDSHGEGVTSVLAGHRMGNLIGHDGVAPGAKVVDYDISELTDKPEEKQYTIGKFLMGLEWLAQNGAEVVNISYSLYYTNAKSQTFMAEALQKLVDKYNFILCFSAGNNGPGLGSLNRRLIYPSSVLVAGAYISKELDERVYGVTGIPEEGRVVYYSSRGAGAGSLGPLMIAPLSNLTHSTPNKGFQAFNGTSSASPALAGAATVLISAIKQAGLKVDASTVVHALRLSAKKLKNEPFIAQGYGIPQLSRAFEVYQELVKGQNFININHSTNRQGSDGVASQSIVVKKSSAGVIETFRIRITGELSKLAPHNASTDFLLPVDIEYTDGITGPSELWLSVTSGQMFVDVKIDELLKEKREAFGEIKIFSQIDKSLLAVIPVTAINDTEIRGFYRSSLTVSSQEGARLHLNVPSNVKFLKVRARIIDGDRRLLTLGTFNPDFIRVRSHPFVSEYIIPTEKAGHYQITLIMAGGTSRSATVEFEIEDIDLRLLSTDVQADKGSISLRNDSNALVHGNIILTPKAPPLKSIVFAGKTAAPELIMTLPKGNYNVELKPTSKYDLSYFFSSCTIIEKNASGVVTKLKTNSFKYEGEGQTTVHVRCVPFDFEIENPDVLWKMNVTSSNATIKNHVNLPMSSRTPMKLPKLVPGIYQVEFGDPMTEDKVYLGEIEAF